MWVLHFFNQWFWMLNMLTEDNTITTVKNYCYFKLRSLHLQHKILFSKQYLKFCCELPLGGAADISESQKTRRKWCFHLHRLSKQSQCILLETNNIYNMNSQACLCQLLLYHSFMNVPNIEISFQALWVRSAASHITVIMLPSVPSVFLHAVYHCFSRGITQNFSFTEGKLKRSNIICSFVSAQGLTAGQGWTQQIGLHLTAFTPS